jgi:methylated-DNA-[protein]-cysteine S-methyltransferase
MTTRWMDSPVGGLRIHTHDGYLTRLDFDAEPRGTRASDTVADAAESQLAEYFAGERTEFDLPLRPDGTDFQRAVWQQVQRIGWGQTASYGDIARSLGYEPGVSRAVGAANGANPIPIVIPCHRVIGANGALTGYSGGVERKTALLTLETPGLF